MRFACRMPKAGTPTHTDTHTHTHQLILSHLIKYFISTLKINFRNWRHELTDVTNCSAKLNVWCRPRAKEYSFVQCSVCKWPVIRQRTNRNTLYFKNRYYNLHCCPRHKFVRRHCSATQYIADSDMQNALLCCQYNNGQAFAPHCYGIQTLRMLVFMLQIWLC